MLSSPSKRARKWVANLRGDALSGIVVALALIPEAIGFSVIAGVDPKVGLYASVVIACVIAFTGGLSAIISAATAATAVVMGGCAMIGQSVINVSSGARGRLSTLVAGFLPAGAARRSAGSAGRGAGRRADGGDDHGLA